MDDEYVKNVRRGSTRRLELLPSEYCRSGRLFWHGELERRSLKTMLEYVRPDVFFYASDFPHASSEKVIEEVREFVERKDLDEDLKRNLLAGTAQKIYNFDRLKERQKRAL